MILFTVVRTVFWNIVFWALLTFSLVFLLINSILKLFKLNTASARFISALASFWAELHLLLSGSTFKIHGKENIPDDHSFCIVSNHQGYFDIPVILRAIPWPVGFVAKKELAKVPLLSLWMKAFGVIFLDRSDRRKAIDVMKRASERIKSGHPMVVFPEGTRSQGGPVAPFKQASLKLATLAKTRILPVTISGTSEIIEGKKWGINPSKVDLYIHPVIDVAELDEEEIPELANRLREIIKQPLEN